MREDSKTELLIVAIQWEKMLVDVCLLRMIEEYCIFLKNLSFPSFFKLIEAARHPKESLRSSSASWSSSSSYLVATFDRERDLDRPSQGTNPGKMRAQEVSILPPFPYGLRKVIILMDKWVKNRSVSLPEVQSFHPCEDQENPMYCPYHEKKGHTLELSFRKVFNKEAQWGKNVLLKRFRSTLETSLPFPKETP